MAANPSLPTDGAVTVPASVATRRRRFRGGVRKDQAPWPMAVLAWIVAIVMFFPIYQFVITGFKTEQEAVILPPRLVPWPGYQEPTTATESLTNVDSTQASQAAQQTDRGWDFRFRATLNRYHEIFRVSFGSFLLNSILASVISTFFVLLLGIPAAYSLSIRAGARAPNALFFLISTKFLPAAGVLVPLLVIYRRVHLLNTLQGLIILYIAMNLPIAIWVLRSFFQEVPKDVIDAARLDGATPLQEIFQVIAPMIRPGIVATAFICMIFAWNEFFLAAFLAAVGKSTVPIFMLQNVTGEGLFWAKLSAAVTIGVLPIVLLGWSAQRQLVRGLSLGAVK